MKLLNVQSIHTHIHTLNKFKYYLWDLWHLHYTNSTTTAACLNGVSPVYCHPAHNWPPCHYSNCIHKQLLVMTWSLRL